MADTTRPATANRAYALDALRGIAILAMLLSGQLPFGEHSLPAWMYHAQEPPPTHELDRTVFGITWVDLVFPFFLFCMGAAFPLSLHKKMDGKSNPPKLAGMVIERGFLLGFFAILVEAIRMSVYGKNHSEHVTQALALLGFVLMFMIFARLPSKWTAFLQLSIKGLGWLGAILFLGLIAHPIEGDFLGSLNVFRKQVLSGSDIIILVLTNMVLFGMPIWMLTRKNWLPRLGVIGFMLAIRLSNIPAPLPGWVSQFWKYSPAPWLYQLYYLQYLCIVIPGTIAGDLIWQWINTPAVNDKPQKSWSPVQHVALAFVGFASVLTILIGLKIQYVFTTTLICLALCFLGWLISRKPYTETERLFSRLFQWGTYWLILGLLFEPYEGGIRKSQPATVSYYFVTAGLANFCIITLSVFIDVLKRRSWFQLFIDNGQNPMIAYAGINNFIVPLLGITGIGGLLGKMVTSPWMGFWHGLIVTLLMAVTVSFLTRRKIFWRT